MVERAVHRFAELGARGEPGELPRERARVAAADLRERTARGETGRDRHAHQVQHVGQFSFDLTAPVVGPSSEAELWEAKPVTGAMSRNARPSRPGAAVISGSAVSVVRI